MQGLQQLNTAPTALSVKADFMTDLQYTNHMNKAGFRGTTRPKDHSRTCPGPHPAQHTLECMHHGEREL